MIKQVSLMKRHPSLTMEQFIDRYESHHARFGEVLFARAARFVRRYVRPQVNPLTGEAKELDFDVVMEIWWHEQADFDAAMAAIPKSPLLPEIVASGATLFASRDNPAFTVDERDTDLAALR